MPFYTYIVVDTGVTAENQTETVNVSSVEEK